MPKPLEITFHGPFVFRFGCKYAWAYAPKCDQHYLNILTDAEDVVLPNDKTKKPKRIRTFCLTGPKSGTTVQLGDNEIITLDWYSGEKEKKKNEKKKGWPETEQHWDYVLSFPAPDYIYGLVPEPVTIQGYPDSSTTTDLYARALRFRYNKSDGPKFRYNDSGSTQLELCCEDKKNKIDITADHLGGADPSYSIEIRYSHYHRVIPTQKDHYDDAKRCFESMRKNLPPCNKWKAIFGKYPAKSGVGLVKRLIPFKFVSPTGPNGPHDCGAPVMALKDGISLNPVPGAKTRVRSTTGKSKK